MSMSYKIRFRSVVVDLTYNSIYNTLSLVGFCSVGVGEFVYGFNADFPGE